MEVVKVDGLGVDGLGVDGVGVEGVGGVEVVERVEVKVEVVKWEVEGVNSKVGVEGV